MRFVRPLAKLTVTAAILVAIGWIVLTVGADGEVAETRADIVDFSYFDGTSSQNFARALEQLGHEKPRTYAVGRELVYFSVKSSRRDARQLLEEYQHTFVVQGINERRYTRPISLLSPEADAMLRGEILTLSKSDERFTMGGGRIDRNAADKSFAEGFRSMRHLEAQTIDGRTIVTAVWTHDDFDAREASRPKAANPEIPACPGCIALAGFDTVEGDMPASSLRFESKTSSAEVHRFYRRALRSRGWRETESSQNAPDENISEYKTGQRHLTIVTRPHGAGTSVSIVHLD